jgi:hypothetical protein
MQTTGNKTYEEIRAHPDLPSPTGVALAILDLVESEDCSVGELIRECKTGFGTTEY